MRKLAAVTVGCMLVAAPALAANSHCTADIAEISAAMSKAKLNAADAKAVQEALAKGAELDKAGKDEDCEKALAPAHKLFGLKDKHSH